MSDWSVPGLGTDDFVTESGDFSSGSREYSGTVTLSNTYRPNAFHVSIGGAYNSYAGGLGVDVRSLNTDGNGNVTGFNYKVTGPGSLTNTTNWYVLGVPV